MDPEGGPVIVRSWRDRRMGSPCVMGVEFPSEKTEEFSGRVVAMAAQLRGCTKCDRTIHLKAVDMVNSVLRIFYHSKK